MHPRRGKSRQKRRSEPNIKTQTMSISRQVIRFRPSRPVDDRLPGSSQVATARPNPRNAGGVRPRRYADPGGDRRSWPRWRDSAVSLCKREIDGMVVTYPPRLATAQGRTSARHGSVQVRRAWLAYESENQTGHARSVSCPAGGATSSPGGPGTQTRTGAVEGTVLTRNGLRRMPPHARSHAR